MFRSGTGSEAAAFLTAIPSAAVTSKRSGKEFSMYAADNARFRVQCKLRFRYRLVQRPAHLLPTAWLCTKCNRQLDEFGDHAQGCCHLKGGSVIRHNGIRDVIHAQAASVKPVRSYCEPTMTSIGAVVKPELSQQAQAKLDIPNHRADVAINPDPTRGVNFADTLVIDVTVTASTSTLKKAYAGPTMKDKDTGAVTAGDGRATGAAAEAKANWKVDFYAVRYANMQKGNFFPFVVESQGYLHPRARVLLCKIARLQAEYADQQRRAAKYPSYAPLGVRTRRLIERVSASLQFGNSTLMLRYMQDCVPRV